MRYVGSTYTGSRSEWVRVPSGTSHSGVAHGHSGGGGGGSNSSEGGGKPVPHPYDVIVNDPSFLETKAECVLEGLQGGQTIQDLLEEYTQNDGSVNVTFKVKELAPGDDLHGQTNCQSPYNDCTITIDESYQQNARTIEVARTILHEAVHAKIYSYLRTHKVDLNNISQNDFPALFDAYVRAKTSGETYQHELMAEKYVKVIAEGIQKYDELNTNNPEITFEHYEALAWVGLEETYAYKNVLTNSERQEIEDKRDLIISWFSKISCNK